MGLMKVGGGINTVNFKDKQTSLPINNQKPLNYLENGSS